MTNEDILYSPIDGTPEPQKKGLNCTDRDIIQFLISRFRSGASPSALFDHIENLSAKWDDLGEPCEYGGMTYKHKSRRTIAPDRSDAELNRRLRELLARSNLPPVCPDPVIHPMRMTSAEFLQEWGKNAPPAEVKPLRDGYGTQRWIIPSEDKQEQIEPGTVRSFIEKIRAGQKRAAACQTKPTIHELEEILESAPETVHILPDGSITTRSDHVSVAQITPVKKSPLYTRYVHVEFDDSDTGATMEISQ